jgi:selenocysteine lyase/cysteine desulfurase
VQAFAEENVHYGARYYDRWLEVEQELRERLQLLIDAQSSGEIGLLKNTSEALSVVAYGINWQAGDNVVISDQEFPSNRIVWESLQARFGVEVRYANLQHPDLGPEQAVLDRLDQNTRLLSLSSVQYGTGLKLDLARIGDVCQQQGILFCVDAIQSIGALDFDVQAIHADFVMADGHKWMLGPEGVALFYCRREHFQLLQLNQYGWHMVENPGDFDQKTWQAADSALRFEAGSPNMLGIHALNASISLLLEVGMPEVEQQVLAKARYLLTAIGQHPDYQLLTHSDEAYGSGIVTFNSLRQSSELLFRQLTQQGIQCAYRNGGIRFSAHFYTPTERLDCALRQLGIQA